MNFQGRTVLVTGGTRGIGRGIVQVFARSGAQVAVNGTKIDLCKEAAEEADSLGGKGLAVPGDISKYESVRDIFKEVYDAFGELNYVSGFRRGSIYHGTVNKRDRWYRSALIEICILRQ